METTTSSQEDLEHMHQELMANGVLLRRPDFTDADEPGAHPEVWSCRTWTVVPQKLSDGWHYLLMGIDPERQTKDIPVVASTRQFETSGEAIKEGTLHIQRRVEKALIVPYTSARSSLEKRGVIEPVIDHDTLSHEDRRPKTLDEAFKRWPQSVWLYDGDEKLFFRPHEIEMQMREIDARIAVRLTSWETLRFAPIIWRGANVHFDLAAATGDPSGPKGWFLRLLATGQESKEGSTLERTLRKFPDAFFVDRNRGNDDETDDHWFSGVATATGIIYSLEHGIGGHREGCDEVASCRAILQSDICAHDEDLFVFDTETHDHYYLMSATGKPVQPKPLPAGWRSDAPLIKHLEQEWGVEVARAWQSLPLVDAGDERERIMEQKADVVALVKRLDWLPFDSFLLDLGYVQTDLADIRIPVAHTWVRVSRLETWSRSWQRFAPWMEKVPRQAVEASGDPELHGSNWEEEEERKLREGGPPIQLEVWIASVDHIHWSLPYTVQLWSAWLDAAPSLMLDRAMLRRQGKVDEKVIRAIIDRVSSWTAVVLGYFAMMPEYLVELATAPVGRVDHKRKEKKLWTRTDLKRVVLWDVRRRVRRPRRTEEGDRQHIEYSHAFQRRATKCILLAERYYRYGSHRSDVIASENCAPESALAAIEYSLPHFMSGLDGSGKPRVFRRQASGLPWVELRVRVVPRSRSRWIGPLEGIDEEAGVQYRVLLRESESGMERG